uniref:Uncharacterized protein n=1 Tax=Molossus molossus TaxID=27622 RepID=A0A7J8FYQ9_MOLMO|nr:hypothetical protein HJG59_008183 [Molossus molossus]
MNRISRFHLILTVFWFFILFPCSRVISSLRHLSSLSGKVMIPKQTSVVGAGQNNDSYHSKQPKIPMFLLIAKWVLLLRIAFQVPYMETLSLSLLTAFFAALLVPLHHLGSPPHLLSYEGGMYFLSNIIICPIRLLNPCQ